MSRLASVLVSSLLLALAAGPGVAQAVPPSQPKNVVVEGGAESWRSIPRFLISWDEADPAEVITGFGFLVRDPGGSTVLSDSVGVAITRIDLTLPSVPGAYTFVLWSIDFLGRKSDQAIASLRFDDRLPASPSPDRIAGWVGRADFPLRVRVDRGAGVPPASGIRGFALSVDGVAGAHPCLNLARCVERAPDPGATAATFAIEELGEGISHLNAVAISGAGLTSAQVGTSALRVDKTPPLLGIEGLPRGWVNRSVGLTAIATDELSGMEGGGAYTAIRVDGRAPIRAGGDQVTTSVVDSGVHHVEYFGQDAAGNVSDGGVVNGHRSPQPRSAWVRIDREPPRVAFRASVDPADPEALTATVTDADSGPADTEGWIGVRRLGSGDLFERLPTVVGKGTLRAHWDSERYPHGDYEFEAVGFDAAGNRTRSTVRQGGGRHLLSNPVKLVTSLSAGFGGRTMVWHNCVRVREGRRCRREIVASFERRPQSRVVPSGRGILFSGRLSGPPAGELAQAPVQVWEIFGPNSARQAEVTELLTGADGGFRVRLEPGPSREVVARFNGTKTLGSSLAGAVRLGVRTGLSLRASAPSAAVGGRPVIFRGRVRAAPGEIPAEGKSVALQFRVDGGEWNEFRTVQTDRAGRFRYPYRFSDNDSRGVRFQFRAHAPAQGGWPYEPGSSRPVAVRGR